MSPRCWFRNLERQLNRSLTGFDFGQWCRCRCYSWVVAMGTCVPKVAVWCRSCPKVGRSKRASETIWVYGRLQLQAG